MAPRSKRGKERENFDRSKFATAAAHFRYHEFATSRKFISEQSFYNPGEAIENTIVAHNWQRFCYFTAVAVIPVVREFYANFMDAEDYEVFVRGVGVGFTPERINIFYGLPPTVECYYSGLSPSEGDLEMIIAYLTDSTGAWKIWNEKWVNFKSS
ncbi:hypothetical protein, partial [Bacillus amyloliquefaciens]|uniref:hypothetical protein n=1 Tax=Bacillus amyloliquefaciens TaxID=1390 RepID=UPI00197AB34D